MRKYAIMLLLTILVTIAACTQTKTSEITSFEECVAAGNPVMESFPRQCSVNGESFVENVEVVIEDDTHLCTDEEKAAEVCTMEYMPVCGDNGKTYGNECTACSSGEIDHYYEGECPDFEPSTQIANPASVYCVEQNGELNIIDTELGQVGYCTLPDGRVCEEWAYFRSEGKNCLEQE